MRSDHQRLIHIGGRKSALAIVQSEIVKAKIEAKFSDLKCSVLAINALGDNVQNKPLYSFGGKAVWTKELEVLLLETVNDVPQLDLVVHSLKDMPTNLPEEFELGCILDREDPRDALVVKQGSPYKSLADLPKGSLVGTSSVRRSAQLMKNFPGLKFDSVRGSLPTRLRKLDEPEGPFECIVLAAAGLKRLGMTERITSYLSSDEMYHAVGQGALGVEIKKGDKKILEILQKIEDLSTTYCCLAERALMRHLEGGCSVPIGVNTDYDRDTNHLTLKGVVVSPDGTQSVEGELKEIVNTKQDALKLGENLGDYLISKGAKKILDAIDFERINQPPTKKPEEGMSL